MIGGLAMLAMSAILPLDGAEQFDLADARPALNREYDDADRFLLPDVEEPAPPEKARLRVRGRTVKWRVPLGSF